jgi:hypothetical protein
VELAAPQVALSPSSILTPTTASLIAATLPATSLAPTRPTDAEVVPSIRSTQDRAHSELFTPRPRLFFHFHRFATSTDFRFLHLLHSSPPQYTVYNEDTPVGNYSRWESYGCYERKDYNGRQSFSIELPTTTSVPDCLRQCREYGNGTSTLCG